MKVTLKEFQEEYVAELVAKFGNAQQFVATTSTAMALLLSAPTGSGKTLMMTALMEHLLEGTDEVPGDPGLTFLWLTDQPELNRQTYEKIVATSGLLTPAKLVIIDAGVDLEQLVPGTIYLLNTQKLGSATSFVKPSDERTFTLWQTIRNTAEASPTRFVLIVDEAHRGAVGKDANEAETIFQKFVMGSPGEVPPVPLIIGVSATPDRFVRLCTDVGRPLLRVDVAPERVRESGLLKEFVDLFHPEEKQSGDATMLVSGIGTWKRYRDDWASYAGTQSEGVPEPVLLVQVEDARRGATTLSSTDLTMVVGLLVSEFAGDATDGWIAHAFQDEIDIVVGGHSIPHVAPSKISADERIKVVLFKTSLNTGWDCPRAEVMVSFRTAKDETNIAQLVGRMVRAPLARRIDSNEHLNSVALYLPYYDTDTVEKVVKRLTDSPGDVGAVTARAGTSVVALHRNPAAAECFEVLESLPTQTVPRVKSLKATARVAKLASLLAEMGLEPEPVKDYRSRLIEVLEAHRERLADDPGFKDRLDEAAVLDIRRRRLHYAPATPPPDASADGGTGRGESPMSKTVRAVIADLNVDDLYAEAGRRLGEGLHKEYLRQRVRSGVSARVAKLELHALIATPGIIESVFSAADKQRASWVAAHKSAFRKCDDRYRQVFREIEGSGERPETINITAPAVIEWPAASMRWDRHLYVDAKGNFAEDFSKSTWERRVVAAELKRDDVVGWLRNLDRKPWSLCIARQDGTKWSGIYPDFVFFRRTTGGVIADIIDPHLLSEQHAPARAAALAQFAAQHNEDFGRIEMIIFDSPSDDTGKRLDLTNERVRNRVAAIDSHAALQQLFDDASLYSIT